MTGENTQLALLDEKREWEKEWRGMPEFMQGKIKPYAQVIVRFRSKEDLQEFAQLIGQRLTFRTKSIWHPSIIRGKDCHKRYKDES